ncbi:MAG: hypothetical protein NC218_06365 [Acetobacter sp.]|nr:hypothetical protein [Acetobacter sp.]
MTLKDDLKRQAESATVKLAMVATLATSPLQAAAVYQTTKDTDDHQIELAEGHSQESENLPNPFSAEEIADVKDAMHQDYDDVLAEDKSVAEKKRKYNLKAQKLFNQLNSPIEGRVVNECFLVGNWGNVLRQAYEIRAGCKDANLSKEERLEFQQKKIKMIKATIDTSKVQAVPERADDLIDRSRLKIVNNDDDVLKQGSYAYFSPSSNTITLHRYAMDEQDYKGNYLSEYTRGNPIAQASTLVHENVHEDHHNYDGFGQLNFSPINAAKGDRLTETVAVAAEYLYAANQYTQMKTQGAETFQCEVNAPLDGILVEYMNKEDNKKSDLAEYLSSYGIETVHICEKKSLKSILSDYKILKDENKPSLEEYLKNLGIEKLQIVETENLATFLKEFANEKKAGNIPDFEEMVQLLDKLNCRIACDADSYSMEDYFKYEMPEAEKVINEGGDIESLIETYAANNFEVEIPGEASVEKLHNMQDLGDIEISEFLKKNKLYDGQYRLNYDMPVEEVTLAWSSFSKDVKTEDELLEKLKGCGLTNAYATVVKELPTESILEMYPGLKEAVGEKVFDVKDTESVARVVKVATDIWEEERIDDYEAQTLNAANVGQKCFASRSWSEQIKILENQDRVYQEVSERMLKDVYIGNNTTVDLSGCRDMLDTLSTRDACNMISEHNEGITAGWLFDVSICSNYISVISLEEMKKVDAYLEGKGLKTDEQKMGYMSEYLDNIAYRRPKEKDNALTEILLAHNPNITFEDGLSVEHQSDGSFFAMLNGKSYNLTSFMAKETPQQNASMVNAMCLDKGR